MSRKLLKSTVLRKLRFTDGAFDIVVCLDVLEHAESLEETLAEIARVLTPGGHAIVTATNRFVFRDPHYHLRGINWLPHPLAEESAMFERA